MRTLNEMWRVCRSVYRVKFIGAIDTSTHSMHVDKKTGEKYASISICISTHYYTISIGEKLLRDLLKSLEEKK